MHVAMLSMASAVSYTVNVKRVKRFQDNREANYTVYLFIHGLYKV